MVQESFGDVFMTAPQIDRVQVFMIPVPTQCFTIWAPQVVTITSKIPAWAADWGTPSTNMRCFAVVPGGPDDSIPGSECPAERILTQVNVPSFAVDHDAPKEAEREERDSVDTMGRHVGS